MSVGIPTLGTTRLYTYGYDQLNRLVKMDSWTGYKADSAIWGAASTHNDGDYAERIVYDANGNILEYLRHGRVGNLNMDSLNYKYYANTNQLRQVRDSVGDGNYSVASEGVDDLDNQSDTSNYQYDAIGNLIKDVKEDITNIDWTVYGKIKKITKGSGTTISYTYDVAGNRISKAVTSSGTTTTTYSRDAQGNPMAVYTGTSTTLSLVEQHLYGSSRLGIWNRNIDMDAESGTGSTFARGFKLFENSNHLGNELVIISDRKIGIDNSSDGIIDYYISDVVNANDYYTFGMLMPGRKFSAGGLYRYGFNGQERTTEINPDGNSMTAEFWQYDSRIGRRWNMDPVTRRIESPYFCFSGNPILLSDKNGDDPSDWIRRKNADGSYTYSWDKNVTKSEETPKGYEYVGNTGEYYINNTQRILLWRGGNWSYGNEDGGTLGTNPPNQPASFPAVSFKVQSEPEILAPDIYGNGVIGPRSAVEDRVGAIRLEHNKAIGENIKGGIFGAVGYLIGGERGSYVGAVADNLAVGAELSKTSRSLGTRPIYHSMYGDGVFVLEGQQPGNVNGSESAFPNSAIKWDYINSRVYKARTFGLNNQPLYDLDFTLPTFPNGRVRPDHTIPEQHMYIPNPTGGSLQREKSGKPFKLNLGSGIDYKGNHIVD